MSETTRTPTDVLADIAHHHGSAAQQLAGRHGLALIEVIARALYALDSKAEDLSYLEAIDTSYDADVDVTVSVHEAAAAVVETLVLSPIDDDGQNRICEGDGEINMAIDGIMTAGFTCGDDACADADPNLPPLQPHHL